MIHSSRALNALKDILSKKTCYITCSGRLDGVGAQAWATICTMITGKYLGFQYIYTPFDHVDHNDMNLPTNKWLKRWDNILSIGKSEMTMQEWKISFRRGGHHKNVVERCNIHRRKRTTPKAGVGKKVLLVWSKVFRSTPEKLSSLMRTNDCFLIKECEKAFFYALETDPVKMQQIISETQVQLQSNYHLNSINSKKYFQPQAQPIQKNVYKNSCEKRIVKKNIAVHIRRGDVVRWGIEKRFMNNNYFWNILDQVVGYLLESNDISKKDIAIHVFSEGTLLQDFPELTQIGEEDKESCEHCEHCKLVNFNEKEGEEGEGDWAFINDHRICMHLNGDPCNAFQHLVASDILITSKSCFSYLAAFLNLNTVIFTPFWFPQLNIDWVSVKDESIVDREIFFSSLNKSKEIHEIIEKNRNTNKVTECDNQITGEEKIQ